MIICKCLAERQPCFSFSDQDYLNELQTLLYSKYKLLCCQFLVLIHLYSRRKQVSTLKKKSNEPEPPSLGTMQRGFCFSLRRCAHAAQSKAVQEYLSYFCFDTSARKSSSSKVIARGDYIASSNSSNSWVL